MSNTNHQSAVIWDGGLSRFLKRARLIKEVLLGQALVPTAKAGPRVLIDITFYLYHLL